MFSAESSNRWRLNWWSFRSGKRGCRQVESLGTKFTQSWSRKTRTRFSLTRLGITTHTTCQSCSFLDVSIFITASSPASFAWALLLCVGSAGWLNCVRSASPSSASSFRFHNARTPTPTPFFSSSSDTRPSSLLWPSRLPLNTTSSYPHITGIAIWNSSVFSRARHAPIRSTGRRPRHLLSPLYLNHPSPVNMHLPSQR